jgi:ABC-type transporter Mla subunit MlaD
MSPEGMCHHRAMTSAYDAAPPPAVPSPASGTEAPLRSRVRTVLEVDQTINKLDATADRLNDTLDTFGALLADFTAALHQFNSSVAGFNGTVTDFQTVVERADGLLGRAEGLLAPLAATQQVGDQLKAASQAAGLVATAAVKRGVAAGKGLAQRG